MREPKKWGISSAGRALGSQSRGQGFEPPMLHQNKEKIYPMKKPDFIGFFATQMPGFQDVYS